MTEPEKLDLKSVSITDDQKARLKQLFPEVFNEDKIDFDKLKRTIGEEIDNGEERFGMTWPGKNDCFKVIQTPSVGTLKPAKEESVNWDTTENLFIEGDNLEVLKLLQGAYYGKVKMIYIDPPYNTGGEFIYPDKYSESLETYLAFTASETDKFSSNPVSEGRFHSKWMNMMYPRLYMARNLLKDDGVIFISIDDNEVKNLRAIMDDIFGEENFVESIVVKNKAGAGAKPKGFITVHEYVVCYANNAKIISGIGMAYSGKILKMFNKRDEQYEQRGPYGTWALSTTSMDDRPNLRFPISYQGEEIWPEKQWLWSQERVEEALKKNELVFNQKKDGTWSVRFKRYLKDEEGNLNEGTPTSFFDGPYTHEGTREMDNLFETRVFGFPKPTGLIKQLFGLKFNQSEDSDGVYLDFFAGSGTTAHAVLDLNKEDSGNRKFICVQLPEPCAEDSEAFKAGYKTIADIGKERIRRVIKKIQEEQAAKGKDAESKLPGMAGEPQAELNLGFKVFKLDKSNFNVWDGTVDESGNVSNQIEMFINHIDPKASDEGILCEILLKTRFPLTTKIEELQIAGKKVFSVADKALLICLDRKLTKELITEMARLQPARIVCLDVGFADNDQLKTNAVQIMKSHGVEDFRTV